MESSFHVVPRRLLITSKVPAIDNDVVTVFLVPVYHLLGALGTLVRVTFTPNWSLPRSDGGGAPCVCDAAPVGLVINVRLSTTIDRYEKRTRNYEESLTYPLGTYH